jgi:hypothetical protein
MRQVSNHARKDLASDRKVVSILHLVLIGYGAVTGTINSGITVWRSMPLSTPILGAFNGATLAIATAGPLVYSVRWSQPLRNMIDVLPISGPIEARRSFYSPTLSTISIFDTDKHSEPAQTTKKASIYASVICLVLLLLIYA